MGTIFDKKLVPSSEAIASAVGDETVILQLKQGAYFGLDATGTRIWELLRDGLTPRAICDRLEEEYDVDRARLEADVGSLLAELEARDLVSAAGRADD